MASFMKQAMSYLGLGPDDTYAPSGDRATPGDLPVADPYVEPAGQSGVTVVERPTAAQTPVSPQGPSGAVRRMAAAPVQPFVLMPRMFDDAQQIGDRFKREQPIILNLQGLDRDTARRLLDFASGLCYARDGEMRKVANAVYMLVPANVVVSSSSPDAAAPQSVGN